MYKCTSRVKCFPPLVIDAAMILTFFWYMQTIVMSVTFPQQGDNTRGVALLFCPIYPKMRFEPLHDLVKKLGLLQSKRDVSRCYNYYLSSRHFLRCFFLISEKIGFFNSYFWPESSLSQVFHVLFPLFPGFSRIVAQEKILSGKLSGGNPEITEIRKKTLRK